ncbi:MAG: hypothetical protein HWN79_02065 [Candidatus Lokiarchaeota archaeon]|nr:hypothetical protein [Candidatus Lokiarchaeota archaeon]
MAETYENFMIFGLESTGEKVKLEISEDKFRANNGQDILNPHQVLVIVKEGLRRIYIWKGVNSHVRKKFIASRIAAELQNELVVKGHFHRCKIISVDQGDEPLEFMRAFNLKPVEIPEVLERDSEEFRQLHANTIKEVAEISDKAVHKWTGSPPVMNDETEIPVEVKKEEEEETIYEFKPNFKPTKLDTKNILENIVINKVPANFKRQNLLLGDFQIYGAVVKKAKVFGEEVEEVEWEPVNSVPEGPIELTDRTIRLYTNSTSGNIEGIEILQRVEAPKIVEKVVVKEEEVDYNSWTVSNLKLYCKEKNIHIPSSYRKEQIIDLILKGAPQESVDKWVDYNRWTVNQLKDYCNENNIKVLASYRKADLVKLVKEHTR